MAKTEENLSQSKYAEHRNVTKGYISRMVKEGRLHLIKGKLNVEMSDAELDNKSNKEKAPNYWAEKALHEKAKRELAELDLGQSETWVQQALGHAFDSKVTRKYMRVREGSMMDVFEKLAKQG